MIMPIVIAIFVLLNKKKLCITSMMIGLLLRAIYYVYSTVVADDIIFQSGTGCVVHNKYNSTILIYERLH